jgi:hypothetical protein
VGDEVGHVGVELGMAHEQGVALLTQHVPDPHRHRHAPALGLGHERQVGLHGVAPGEEEDGLGAEGLDACVRLLGGQVLGDGVHHRELEALGVQTSGDHEQVERLPVVRPLGDVAAELVPDVQPVPGGIEEDDLADASCLGGHRAPCCPMALEYSVTPEGVSRKETG